MFYLVSQILFCLVFTAALALIAGWLLRGASERTRTQAGEQAFARERRRANALEEQVAALRTAGSDVAAAPTVVREARSGSAPGEAVRERMAQLEGIARAQAERIHELAQRVREKEALVAGLRQHLQEDAANGKRMRPGQGAPPNGLLAERPERPDRLQSISGIGPVLERVLNEIGIYRFGQLARLTPDNIEWLATRIDWFPQRIQREDWVGQARRLHHEVHPEEEL